MLDNVMETFAPTEYPPEMRMIRKSSMEMSPAFHHQLTLNLFFHFFSTDSTKVSLRRKAHDKQTQEIPLNSLFTTSSSTSREPEIKLAVDLKR